MPDEMEKDTRGASYGVLDVSPACFEEVAERLAACGFAQFVQREEGQPAVIDARRLVLRRETDERVKVFLMFDGKRLNGPPPLPPRKLAELYTPEPPEVS